MKSIAQTNDFRISLSNIQKFLNFSILPVYFTIDSNAFLENVFNMFKNIQFFEKFNFQTLTIFHLNYHYIIAAFCYFASK